MRSDGSTVAINFDRSSSKETSSKAVLRVVSLLYRVALCSRSKQNTDRSAKLSLQPRGLLSCAERRQPTRLSLGERVSVAHCARSFTATRERSAQRNNGGSLLGPQRSVTPPGVVPANVVP